MRLFKFLKFTIDFLEYLFRMIRYENFTNYLNRARHLSKCTSNEVILLANGPSLKKEIEKIKDGDEFFQNKDFCIVNYIPESDIYEMIKPKYYVITDGQFSDESHPNFKRAQAMFERMVEVTDWEMNIYIQFAHKQRKSFNIFKNNPHIEISVIHTTPYKGFEKLRFYFYNKGLGNGEFGTVIINAEYVMLYNGYKRLHLYGVDHNFFDGLFVNNKNQLCIKYDHYYSKDKSKIIKYHKDVSGFLSWYAELFKGHKIMNNYALSLDAAILNHTNGSMIDAYKRVK